MPNYTDASKPQLTASEFNIRRLGKSMAEWDVQVKEAEYANIAPDDTDFHRPAGGMGFRVGAEKFAEAFPLVDPVTLEPVKETATYGQLFALIQAAYMHEARRRDERDALLAQAGDSVGGS